MSDSSGFGRDDLERLAQRAVDSVLLLVRRGIALAGGMLMLAVVFGGGGFLLGLAALSDGIRSVWVVLGGFFAVVAIGAAATAIWRLRSVRRSADELSTEILALISGNSQTERTVIETVESADGVQNDGVVVMARQFSSMKSQIGDRAGQFRSLTSALHSVTTFPALIALSLVVSVVFVGLSAIFLLALAL